MNEYGKKILFWTGVVLVSAGVSFGTFKIMEKSISSNTSKNLQNTDYAKNVGFDVVSHGPEYQTEFTKAAEMTVNAVVHIKSTVTSTQSYYDPIMELFYGNRGQQQPQTKVGFGSGVIISADGYIVTNNHVIDNSDEIEVTLNDNRQFKATLVGTDPMTDIALLKIDGDSFPVIKFGNSDELKVGEWVLAVGNPFMLNSTVTAGIVSAKGRSIGIIGSNQSNQRLGIESFIQTDAAVNPGNSGGALVNTNGELVGINTAIFSETGNYAGYSFAVPSSIVSKVVTDIKQFGTVQRAVLGISIVDLTKESAEQYNLKLTEGVLVQGVADGSAAAVAGIKEGDVIVAINGKTIKNSAQLQEQIARYRPGDKVNVTYVSNGKNNTVEITLKNAGGNTNVVKKQGVEVLGADFKELTANDLNRLGLRNGVQVTDVKDGKFKNAGIRNGFIIVKVNEIRISSEKDLEKVYKELTSSNQRGEREPVMFIVGVYPNGKTAYYAIDLAQ
ncbi:MAG: Do family serine endopeptidase [Bacteroidales bacterium]|nr:Do family serine endopeptidase [Bacteroidales bacterium]